MACDERLVARIRTLQARTPGSSERRMFGGVCFMVNGHMVCGVVGGELMVRVGPERYESALQRPHVRPMDFTGRPMDGYVFVDASGTRSDAALKDWLEAAIAFARSLPAKASRRKTRATSRS